MPLYDTIGRGYTAFRRPDPRIAAAIEAALGDADSVVNVGAGAGSYEPAIRTMLAVEPSAVMIRQRAASAAPCLRGSAEALPLKSASVDAAMAILSVHHWSNLERGLAELGRVARKRVVLLTWVPDAAPFWLTDDYFPEIVANDRKIFPPADVLAAMLQRLIGPTRMSPLPIPHDCSDGFLCAYWRRPEAYLDANARNAISAFARINVEPGLAKLRADLSSGRWAERHGHLLTRVAVDLGYRIVSSEERIRAPATCVVTTRYTQPLPQSTDAICNLQRFLQFQVVREPSWIQIGRRGSVSGRSTPFHRK